MERGQVGGNRKPQTFRDCVQCGRRFGPLDRLAQRFCSYACKVKAQATGRCILRKTLSHARNAQSLVAYHLKKGHLTRGGRCEECGATDRRIEAAHRDYRRPLDVRWLCRSCHVKWDKAEPKGATMIVTRWENATGKKAVLDGSTA